MSSPLSFNYIYKLEGGVCLTTLPPDPSPVHTPEPGLGHIIFGRVIVVPVPLLPGRTPVMLRLKLRSLEPEAIVRTQSGSGPGQGIKAMGLIELWVVVVTSCSLLRLLVPS